VVNESTAAGAPAVRHSDKQSGHRDATKETPLFCQGSILRTSSSAISPLRANQRGTPHAHLLGNDGDGLWRQLSGGAKAHGLRDSTGVLDRLEDPVDSAAVTNPPGADLGAGKGARSAKTWMVFVIVNMAVEGGTETVNEAHRFEAACAPAPLPRIKCATRTHRRIRRTALIAYASRSGAQDTRSNLQPFGQAAATHAPEGVAP
jgi:hypothetical protein